MMVVLISYAASTFGFSSMYFASILGTSSVKLQRLITFFCANSGMLKTHSRRRATPKPHFRFIQRPPLLDLSVLGALRTPAPWGAYPLPVRYDIGQRSN